eukprot:6920913-Pyramimonas_sp.AAC.1
MCRLVRLETSDCGRKERFLSKRPVASPEGSYIYCEPCHGLNLAPGELVEFIALVYGLNDAPVLWHRTLTDWLGSIGYR